MKYEILTVFVLRIWYGSFNAEVGWLYWGFTSLQLYFSHVATWKQEITNLWNFKWRGRESNPGPLAPQAKSLTTRPPLLLSMQRISIWNPDVQIQSLMTLLICCWIVLHYIINYPLAIALKGYSNATIRVLMKGGTLLILGQRSNLAPCEGMPRTFCIALVSVIIVIQLSWPGWYN